MVEHGPCRKLIEVSIPLEAINAAAAREKSIRHGHPSTLHLWWARRPLAASRAVLFAQLVDDPSSWPDRFPDEDHQTAERHRLHRLIERLTPWQASRDEAILAEARWEIARSVAWHRGEEPPPASDPAAVSRYLLAHAPSVHDPFCGGGSTLLEAQRLGLCALGSDLNPVAVLISKALVEIPPVFAGRPPVNPDSRSRQELVHGGWTGAHGVAEDTRYYGRWMRREAERRIGQLYPRAQLPDGQEASVAAWLWARTVRSPDPLARGAHVPLVSTFLLSSKSTRQAWVEPVIDRAACSCRFVVRTGKLTNTQQTRLKRGTKSSPGYFSCILTGAPISYAYVDAEANAGRIATRLIAVAADGPRSRIYLDPTPEHERIAASAIPTWKPDQPCRGTFASNAQGRIYGFRTFADYFTPRQLVALTTFADLIAETRERAANDACAAGLGASGTRLHDGGTGAAAYADAIATYLAFALSKLADRGSSLCTWFTARDSTRPTFARQAISMAWDFAEPNTMLTGTGSFEGAVRWTAESLEGMRQQSRGGSVVRMEAARSSCAIRAAVIHTDPPYYDNVGYSDLSDFFYVWLRRALGPREGRAAIWPDLFAAALTPKGQELVANPYRRGSKAKAEAFFIGGMKQALSAMRGASDGQVPLAIYYAFKQTEAAKEGIASRGWASFLQAAVDSGLTVVGTWPLRTELGNRLIGMGTNALASSIVLVCRKRAATAGAVERETFVRVLRRELPPALARMRAGGIGAVDMAQCAIGPGMGAFTRYAAVLEDSGDVMTVRTALSLINRVRDEIDQDDDAAYDLATRFALDWFAEAGWEARDSGDAILAANARNLALESLVRTGMIVTKAGRTRLISRDEMSERHRSATVWQATQSLAAALTAEDGGHAKAAAVMARLADREAVRALAYRLYGLCDRKGWAAEALVWNRLAEEWRSIVQLTEAAAPTVTPDLFGPVA
ncbi:MAG TPA: DUF1156 domain-containing protein [Acetobacteraceae bacterium]|nr:DUF1156 domain-containing protein [Acetobacteraceae bacterium]